MHIPTSTYRIQFNKDFNFSHLDAILDYLDELGISTIYASPLLQAAKGSTHGYDGIDPTRINDEVGTEDDLARLAGRLREKGMSWVQDIVPNHLAFDTNNIWLKDVLERGINSSYATYFDIDWEHPFYQNKLMVPFLEATTVQCLEEGKLQLEFAADGFFIVYYNNRYPVNIDSYPLILSGCLGDEGNHVNAAISALVNNVTTGIDHWKVMKDDLLSLLHQDEYREAITKKVAAINADREFLAKIISSQHYVLCIHTESNLQINYRRFFNVNGLICLRMEDQRVFDDYHRYTHNLYEKGYIHGLRIDHVDGLKNPREYFDRLRQLFGPDCYVIVEKILDVKEELPESFDIQGTSGYEFLSYINQVITDNKGAEKLLATYHSFVPEYTDYEKMVFENKLSNLESYLNGEWDNLLRMLLSLNIIEDEEIRMANLKMALGVFMAGFPVYRAYIEALPLTDHDRNLVDLGFAEARSRHPELNYELDVLREMFEPHEDAVKHDNRLLFVQRLMQFTGPLAAKGVEDTTFYRYNPLISHNEVGDEPCVLGITTQTFHEKMQERQRRNPLSFNCTSTHDTKRGEDGRVRINIISELANEWAGLVKHWQEINEPIRRDIGEVRAPIVNDEYFLYQVLVGGFPEDFVVTPEFIERTKKYAVKALRESKLMSDYLNPNTAYEEACLAFIDHLLNPNHSFLPSLMPFVKKIIGYANTYTMVQVIMKTTAPGIPDIYRGCELWDISYVDPDNRRPVNFDLRKKMVAELNEREQQGGEEMLAWAKEHYELGTQKMFVTKEVLQLRRQKKDLFTHGEYIPLYGEGSNREVIAYLRRYKEEWALVVLPLGIVANTGKQFSLTLPPDAPTQWRNIFTEETVTGPVIEVHELFRRFPVAVLAAGS